MQINAAVFTLGCKVNQYESSAIVSALLNLGLNSFEGLKIADIYIINTCSVTKEADRKSRQAINRALKLNSNAYIIILGCSSQNDAKSFWNKQRVWAVFGTANKIDNVSKAAMQIVQVINQKKEQGFNKAENETSNILLTNPLKPNTFKQFSYKDTSNVYEDNLFPSLSKTRGYIKIQDGCDCFCSYCKVPYLRGKSRSRDVLSILNEANLMQQQVKEIVFTGVDISDYGKNLVNLNIDNKINLTYLIGKLKSDVRKRLGSLECRVIDEDFLKAVGDSGFCDHFHLSLQSGSDSVLKRMNRHYTTSEYLKKVELIRKYFPFAGITTDVIAGFSQESQKEHEETKAFLKQVAFSDIHVFPFSAREGTAAFKLPMLSKAVVNDRAAEISIIKDELKANFLKQNLGRICDVYAEEEDNDFTIGFTSNYIKVYTKLNCGQLKNQRLTKLFELGVLGVDA